MSASRIRAASAADAEAIAHVHVQAWRETYPGIVPDDILDRLSVDRRRAMWDHLLATAEDEDGQSIFVAIEGERVVGFAAGGPARDIRLGANGEIGSIYLLNEAKRRGIGRDLFGAVRAALAERGFRSVGLWVAEGNRPARRFYEALGGRVGVTKCEDRGTWTLREVAYLWD